MDEVHPPILGFALPRVELSGASGITTFSYILHPFGRQPLALLACTLQSLFGDVASINDATF
jgi:hypothetical protein